MSINDDVEFTPKRKRYKSLIEFLLEYRDFEELQVEWKTARSKVRNMTSAYNKAKEWEGSTGAGYMDGDTIKSSLLKKFRYFYEFDDIFGGRLNPCAVVAEIIETADISIEALSPAQMPVEYIPEQWLRTLYNYIQ